MQKIAVYLFLLVLPVIVFSQQIFTLSNVETATIENYTVLPDHNYSLNSFLANTSLPFVANDSLRPGQANGFWLKLTIRNQFSEARPINLQVLPNLNNTLYYFDANAGQWVHTSNGILTQAANRRISRHDLPGILRANTLNTLYVHIDTRSLKKQGHAFKPSLRIEQAAFATRQEQTIWITWVTSLTVLFLFFLNNVYIWFSFKDRTVLYYLIAQLGGMIFITAYKQVFAVFFPGPVFNIGLQPDGVVGWYDLNQLLMHISIPVIMYSMVQFTRLYLRMRLSFPRLDAFFKYTLYIYLPVSVLFTIINANFLYTEQYAWLFENIFTGSLFTAIIYAGILGYRRRLPAASHFLLANLVSFGFSLAIPLYHLATDINSNSIGNPFLKSLLPDLVVITQTFGFSVALVARTRAIQRRLAAKEMEAGEMEAELREMEFRHQLLEQENRQINSEIRQEKNKIDSLQEKLAANQRELASSTLYIAQKNEMLTKLKGQIKEWKKQYPDKGLAEVESVIQNNLHLDADWNKFRIHFEQVHPKFFEELLAQHPTLTKNEQRLCAYLHINLSTKEIASLLNIDPASVRRAKTRLNKKMGTNNPVSEPEEEGEEA